MVNAAQAKQGDSELFLALAWPKQLRRNPTIYCAHAAPKPQGKINNPISYWNNGNLTQFAGGEEDGFPALIGKAYK